jgi:hypothetical protein
MAPNAKNALRKIDAVLKTALSLHFSPELSLPENPIHANSD